MEGNPVPVAVKITKSFKHHNNAPAHDSNRILQRLALFARGSGLVDVDDLATEALDGRREAGGRSGADLVENGRHDFA